jgi:RNA polymerase sigma factor for flagellar operon FliA
VGTPARVDFQDLVAAGSLGLAMAVVRCDARSDDEFKSYAIQRINGAILDELRTSDPLGRRLRARVSAIRRAQDQVRIRLGRAPEPHEVAEEAALPMSSYEETLRAAEFAEALHDIAMTLLSNPEGADAAIEATVDRRRRWMFVEYAMSKLEPRLKTVIVNLFWEGLPVQAIARRLGVSDSRVCQLRRRALDALRAEVERRERPGS